MSVIRTRSKFKKLPKGAKLCAAYVNIPRSYRTKRCMNLVYQQPYCHEHMST